MADWESARVFSAEGIKTPAQARARAAEAVLATARLVPSLAATLAATAGGKVDARSAIETFGPGKVGSVRVEGLLSVTRGRSSWQCPLVVRTGTATIPPATVKKAAEQAGKAGAAAVITISNEATAANLGRSRTAVPVVHIPWGSLLDHLAEQRMADPEQAAMLAELSRFLGAPELGLRAGGGDMGPHWSDVAKTARTSRLSKRNAGVLDVCRRWDQAINHAAAALGTAIGRDVKQSLTAKLRRDEDARVDAILDAVVASNQLQGVLTVPDAVGELAVVADLAGQRLVTVAVVTPPSGLGKRATVGWLLDGLQGAPKGTVVESWRRNGRQAMAAATVEDLDRDMDLLADARGTLGDSYRVIQVSEMSSGRRGDTGAGFIDSIDAALLQAWNTALGPLSGAPAKAKPRRSAGSTRTSTRSKKKPTSTKRSTTKRSSKSSAGSSSRRSKPKAKPKTSTAPRRSSSSRSSDRSAADLAKDLRRGR